MIKLINSQDFNWQDIPSSLMKVASTGLDSSWATKRAAVLTRELSELRPEPDHTLVHVLAVGDTDRVGANANADGFTGYWNARNHGHFTKRAHVFQNHKNHDPKLAVGSVKLSAYNPEMGRIELVLALENQKCAEAVDKLERGEDISVSMGCKVAYDVCSICGHQAKNPQVYCEHAKYALGKILDDGRQVYVDNPDPHYFDISIVPRPAERTAYSFRKVASSGAITSSAVLAREMGLWVPSDLVEPGEDRVYHKRALLRKLSEMEKEVEGTLSPVDQELTKTFEDEGKLNAKDAEVLRGAGLERVLGHLAEAKVSLPLKDFLRLVSRGSSDAQLDACCPEVHARLPGVFSRMLEDGEECEDCAMDGVPGGIPGLCQSMLSPLISGFGGGAPLQRRITIAIIRGDKPRKLAAPMSKTAAEADAGAEGLARAYARYKLALLTHPANTQDEVLTRVALLQHYTRA